jgi:uncharacterized PurR-regulated membrane protein YhhQ (DUF165 family)
MTWAILYILSIVAINIGYSHMPGWEIFWSVGIGTVFVTRDLAQRKIGHWVLVAMLVAAILSYALADPVVAVASVTAFAVSEASDWLVYTLMRRPLRDRVLVSSAVSTPLDSAVFLGMVGLLSPTLFFTQVASKMMAALFVWSGLRLRPVG